MSIEANRAMALRFFELMSNLDFTNMFRLVADDAVWRVAGRPESFPSAGDQPKAERMKAFDNFAGVFRSLQIHPITTTAEADRVVVEFTAIGETLNGVIYENEFLTKFTFRDGKIGSIYEHCDQQAVFKLAKDMEAAAAR